MKNKKSSIIILHGWGLNGGVYKELATLLRKNGYPVYAPDLPGFGKEPFIKNSMSLDDYVKFLDKFIERNNLSPATLIGHSFGGRVAIKYAWGQPQKVSKLILTGVPVIRHLTIGKKLGFIAAVFGGKILQKFPHRVREIFRKTLYKLIGERDYYKAGPLKEVFKNIIGEDLISFARQLEQPVLLVWGKEDRIVPVSDVSRIKKIISHAQAVVVPDADHKLPYRKPGKFFAAIKSFL